MSFGGGVTKNDADIEVIEDWHPGADAEWKKIQQNTFTRWVNKYLKRVDIAVNDLETDFEEGLKLIRLVEVLSGRSVGKYSRKVTFRSQKLENISLALRFLEKEENIKLVNIDSMAIADKNLKLILGLVWTLILHYSIANQVWNDDLVEEVETQHQLSPKQKLMAWIRAKLPSRLPFTNFTSDWNDGILLGALVDACAPGLEVGWRDWVPSQSLHSTRMSMQLASDHLGIAPLITPEELINPAVDEKSVMTYLAQFPQAKYTPPMGRFSNVDETPFVEMPSKFEMYTHSDSIVPNVVIQDSSGAIVLSTIQKREPKVYDIIYTPHVPGQHRIIASVRDNASGDSMQLAIVSINAILCATLDYESKIRFGEAVNFVIRHAEGIVTDIVVVDLVGNQIPLSFVAEGDAYISTFRPDRKGEYSINVLNKSNHIPGSPFPLVVVSPSTVNIWGRGISSQGIRVGDDLNVHLDVDADTDPATVTVIGPNRKPVSVKETLNQSNRTQLFHFKPISTGKYMVKVLSHGEHVGKSPYEILVLPAAKSEVRAFGPGLENGIANVSSVFFVENASEKVEISVEGPHKQNISVNENKGGSLTVCYTPTAAGISIVNIIDEGEHVMGSPFIVPVYPTNNNSKLSTVCLSDVLANKTPTKDEEVSFRIDAASMEVVAVPKIRIVDDKFNPVSFDVFDVGNGKFECKFKPLKPGRYYFVVSVDGVNVPGSPFMINVADKIVQHKINVSGTGIGPDVSSNQQAVIMIDVNGGDCDKVGLTMYERDGTRVDIEQLRQDSNTVLARYTPEKEGVYQLTIYYGDDVVSKLDVNVKPSKLLEIVVEGLEDKECEVDEFKEIIVKVNDLVPNINGVEIIATEDGRGYQIPVERARQDPSHWKALWVAKKSGIVKFAVYFDGVLVNEARIVVRTREDASKCRAYGNGLERAIVDEKASFTVNMQDAGDGDMTMSIKGPSESKTHVTDLLNGLCTVEYIPLLPGVYEISIAFGKIKEHIPGSPFTVFADYERRPENVLITEYTGRIIAGKLSSFIVNAEKTAAESIDARLPVGNQQPIVELIHSRTYRVTFTAEKRVGQMLCLELLYGGQLLKNRPLNFFIEPDPKSVVLKNYLSDKPLSDILASHNCGILVDARNAGMIEQLSALITGPDQKLCKSHLSRTDDAGVYLLEFVPLMVGDYWINVCINKIPLSDKPFCIRAKSVGNPNKCILRRLSATNRCVLNEPTLFDLNVADAGDGAPNVLMQCEDDADIVFKKQNGDLYHLAITPRVLGKLRITLLYGGLVIPHGIIDLEVFSEDDEPESESYLERSSEFDELTGSPQTHFEQRDFRFLIESQYKFKRLSADVEMPSGTHDIPRIVDNRDGTVTITYQPIEDGHHLLFVKHDAVNMAGSPISFFVDNSRDGYITVYGPGLTEAVVGEPATFTICSKGESSKKLEVSVEGVAKANIKHHDNKDGTSSVVWVPPVPGEYKINIEASGKPVTGSPYTVIVAGDGQKRAHLSIGSTSEVSLNIATADLAGYSASIKSPSGIEEPCFLRQMDSSHIGVSFTPREAGEHLITVKKNGRVLPKAPFRIKVNKTEVGDASKVKVTGQGHSEAICQQFNEFIVDTRGAGFGGLSVAIEGPSKAEIKCTEAKDGLINIAYRPTEPGVYVIWLKFADINVQGSPFTVHCVGKGVGAVKESANKLIQRAPIVFPKQDASLFLKLENASPMETTAKILDPNGQSYDIEVRDLGNNYYQVRFKPEIEGPHAISVFFKGQHIFGSPFPFTVGHCTETGPHRVRAAGVGIQRAETNTKQSFNLYTREAGNGELSITIEGPSKAELEFHEHKDGNSYFEYKVGKPGEYIISVKFNNEHIPDSPFKVFAAAASGEVRRLELAGFAGTGMPGKAYTFNVLTHRAPGHIEAKLHTPKNQIEPIDIVPIDEGESYALRFVPQEAGDYYVDVTLDSAPMRDSPFRLRVGTQEANDPMAITIAGDGIRSAQTGQKCEFIVNTCNAGSGLLQVQVDGPSKVTLDAYETEQGYKVRYMALVPGTYYVAIKYSGVHIPGSPYKVLVDGKELAGREPDTSLIKVDAPAKTSQGTVTQVPVLKGDASKVTIKGAGLNKFFPGRVATFNIDTGLAGDNLLFVGVLTTKGPCEEVTVKHNGNGQYVVMYRIQERVKGFIFVKYGETNVPGSPFAISF